MEEGEGLGTRLVKNYGASRAQEFVSSGCGYNEYHYHVMNNIILSHIDAYYLRSMFAYQHLFQHSSLGPWRGIVIYQTLLSLRRACVYACAYFL